MRRLADDDARTDLIEAAKMLRLSLTEALNSARDIVNCQECGLGQHGEFDAVDAFDAALAKLTTIRISRG